MLHKQHYSETIPSPFKNKKTWDIPATVITAASGTILLGSGIFGTIISAIIGGVIGIIAYWSHNRKHE